MGTGGDLGISEVFPNLKDSVTLCCYLKMDLAGPSSKICRSRIKVCQSDLVP